jgi:tetratricopeptide (TPR) repeat protein
MSGSAAYRLACRASQLFLQGRTREAEPLIRRALKLLPDSYRIRVLAGDILAETQGASSATRQYDAAIRLLPECTDAYLAKANCLLGIGRAREAEQCARKALSAAERRPSFRNVRFLELVYDVLSDALVARAKRKMALAVIRDGLRWTRSDLLRWKLAHLSKL